MGPAMGVSYASTFPRVKNDLAQKNLIMGVVPIGSIHENPRPENGPRVPEAQPKKK
jgi:hypothetical protein